jgi:predicted nucleic acid-binding protein
MDLVVDANILFSALIKESVTSELLFRNDSHLYAPEFIFTEFEKYRELIKRKTERNDEDFDNLLALFERRITLVPLEEIIHFVENAKKISPDIKDVPYVALALKLNIAIWSNDKELKEKQNTISIYSTFDILKLLC